MRVTRNAFDRREEPEPESAPLGLGDIIPWFIAVLLGAAALSVLAKAVLDRKARYDEPTNDWDGRFDHMMQAGSERDKQLRDRTRCLEPSGRHQLNARLGRKALAIAVLLVLVGVIVAGVVGCALLPEASDTSVPEIAATASPEDVIRAYWTAKNQATRDALSSDYKLEQEAELRRRRNPVGSQTDDIDSASVSVDKSRPWDAGERRGRPDRYRGYFAVRETQVHYVLLNDSDFERAGSTSKFVIVVKKTKDSPWRVEEMGTGP